MRGFIVLGLLLGCKNDPDPSPAAEPGLEENFGVVEDQGDAPCENLETSHCLLPFPSDRYRVVGEDGVTRLAFEPDAMPMGVRGERFGVEIFASRDGYGVASPALFMLPGAAHPGGDGVYDPAPSLEPGARTVMIDATTGARIPHWLETDYLIEEEPWIFALRPAVPLPRSARIVVGVRGLVDDAGEPVPAPEPFAALRDRTASHTLGLHARRAHFEEHIFPVLEEAGFPRDELQLAWDFTTASTEEATSDLLTMRDAMLERVGEDGPAYTWTSITAVNDPHIAVIADGIAEVPSFLLPPDAVGLRRLRRGSDGRPVPEGVEEVPFRLQVPHSALASEGPAPVLQYGHGFLGRRAEADNRWLREMADHYGFLVLAANMQGMDETVLPTWLAALGEDGANMAYLADEALQGVTNHLALQRLARGALAHDPAPELQRAGGGSVVDPQTLWYYGNSQGGSVGTVIMGSSVDVPRGVLGVPGCCYPFLMHRSYLFNSYSIALGMLYPDRGDLSVIVGLVGTGWDGFDPLTWAVHITDDPLPGTPPHQVLLHVAREDGQVLNEVSHVLGRAVGAKLLTPAVRPLWGFEEVAERSTEPATLTEWDFGIEPWTDPLTPRPEEPDSHGWLRKQPEAQDQMIHFLRTGEVEHTCDGPCTFDGPP